MLDLKIVQPMRVGSPGRVDINHFLRRARRDFVEIKFDGLRGLLAINAGQVSLRSRRGRDITRQFPELQEGAALLQGHEAVLDGEIIVTDNEGHPVFAHVMRRLVQGDQRRIDILASEMPAVLVAFDLLFADGDDLRHLPLRVRKQRLAALLPSPGNHIVVSPYWEGEDAAIALYDAVCREHIEGLVIKNPESLYVGRRSHRWWKIKAPASRDARTWARHRM
jgi:bifunctional non-homologous end joining protein LigD